ncbi:MAG: cell filamentation protein Fic [Alphaproteobacteria bacterium CG11_big_fil_rev_8_21_14_0_20_44_7]|nr:MAG: cell filamentation protein Fic [Alphaproteobacteria bacterium CG11_big_fil_rev_8_21_14_0_20_44_7]
MEWEKFRLSTRLSLKPEIIEKAYSIISEIDSVKNSWRLTGKLLPQIIERLTHSVIITSTGSSNRIEGNQLSDTEVEALFKNLRIKKFKTRDEQEVAGYLEMLEAVFDNYSDIELKESTVLQFHNDMLKHSEKDERQRGKYKFGSNRVEAKDHQGKLVGIIFDPTPPHLTPKEMQELVEWYNWAVKTNFKHPLILIANFVFEYLAIHPFQDGNGRTSRLLTNLMLLRQGYEFTSVVSHERIIEANKLDYYQALNKTQQSWKKKKEDISSWLIFFLQVLQEQANQALKILEGDNVEYLLSEKQLDLWRWANQLGNREFSRKEAIEALGFPARTIEQIIKKLLGMKKLQKLGEGRATRYKVN